VQSFQCLTDQRANSKLKVLSIVQLGPRKDKGQNLLEDPLSSFLASLRNTDSREVEPIVNIGSIKAILPFVEGMAPYSVSKAGVIALTRALAREYGKNDFRINAIIPGGIITPGTKAVAREVTQLQLSLLRTGVLFNTSLPLKRGGLPYEVARIAAVLASDLPSYVHGALIPVDGGFLSA
jgi:NAD(P)-dependent dehydrogenase (short-subunit alcohol dehydrogenase family)